MAELRVDLDNAAQMALARLRTALGCVETARLKLAELDECRTAVEVEERMQAADAAMCEMRLVIMETRAEFGRIRMCVAAGKICGLMAAVPDKEHERIVASLHRAGDHTLDEEDGR